MGAAGGRAVWVRVRADCLAWVHSGCNPALVRHDPALTAAIVEVSGLADGRTPRTLHMTAPTLPPWGVYPGVAIQFWRQGCTEIPDTKLHSLGSSSTCGGHVGGGYGSCTFPIPAGTTWMTLSAYATTAHLSWSLV